MQKRKINPLPEGKREPDWLPLEDKADVEVTSEAAGHPIEAALLPGENGWRADAPGVQMIRLLFHPALPLQHVRIVIEERERERQQEFLLRVKSNGAWREVVRQQFNFSPGGATREQEDYLLDRKPVDALELRIRPDTSGGDACASLQRLQLA